MDSDTAALIARLALAEEAAAQDRLVAEMVLRGEALPPPTPAQRRLEDPNFVIQTELPELVAIVVESMQPPNESPSRVTDDSYTFNSVIALQSETMEEMDADTAALIAQLAFEDLGEVLTGKKGKSSTEDYLYANSWATALLTDAAYLEAIITAEEAAVHDRLAAEMLSRGEELPPQTAAQSRLENPAFIMHPDLPVTAAVISPALQRLEKKPSSKTVDLVEIPNATQALHATLTCARLEEYRDWDQNASILASVQKPKSELDYLSLAAGPSVNRNKWVQCTVCYESLKYSSALQTPCNHNYCTGCIGTLVEKFTQDESFFPLRCCEKPITITDIDSFVSSALRTTFLQKHAEFSVPAKDRIYCAEATCSTFLGSSEGNTGTGIVCLKCSRSTCLRCKQAEHVGEDCDVNAGTVQLRVLAKRERWQTCPGCRSVVELTEGCYHMTCRCGTQFCYQCAARWKTCTC